MIEFFNLKTVTSDGFVIIASQNRTGINKLEANRTPKFAKNQVSGYEAKYFSRIRRSSKRFDTQPKSISIATRQIAHIL